MRYLSLAEIVELARHVMEQEGQVVQIRDLNALRSALAQPQMTFEGKQLYPTVVEKAAALGFSLIQNHPFLDGNKRIGHAALEVFLILNGYEVNASVEEQERIILDVATGKIKRDEFATWLRAHIKPFEAP